MAQTARDMIKRIAARTGISYEEIGLEVNSLIQSGASLEEAIKKVAVRLGLDPVEYGFDAEAIDAEMRSILGSGYAQTLMITAVLSQMVAPVGRGRLAVPAFLLFAEILSEVKDIPPETHVDIAQSVSESSIRIIDLVTTLVSLFYQWSDDGIKSVSPSCPERLVPLARTVLRRIRLYEHGIWTCLSCGRLVHVSDLSSLLCPECESRAISDDSWVHYDDEHATRHRGGYGRTFDSDDDV